MRYIVSCIMCFIHVSLCYPTQLEHNIESLQMLCAHKIAVQLLYEQEHVHHIIRSYPLLNKVKTLNEKNQTTIICALHEELRACNIEIDQNLDLQQIVHEYKKIKRKERGRTIKIICCLGFFVLFPIVGASGIIDLINWLSSL